MTNTELIGLAQSYFDFTREAEQIKKTLSPMRDQLIAEMREREKEELFLGGRKILCVPVTKNSFDAKGFSAQYPDLARAFSSEKSSVRLEVK